MFSSQTPEIEKRAYYQNYCIDSNQILHSDKDQQISFVDDLNTLITNTRWRTAAILKNRKVGKSQYRPRFKRFWWNLAQWRSTASVQFICCHHMSISLSVCLSITSRYTQIDSEKRLNVYRIMKTVQYYRDSNFLMPEISAKLQWGSVRSQQTISKYLNAIDDSWNMHYIK